MNEIFNAYKNMFKNWSDFSGRTSRREYWFAFLMNFVISMGIYMFLFVISLIFGIIAANNSYETSVILGAVLSVIQFCISGLYSLITFVPSLAISIRRYHDIGHSGIAYLFCFLGTFCCGIGAIVHVVFMCMPGIIGSNQYGNDPNQSYVVDDTIQNYQNYNTL